MKTTRWKILFVEDNEIDRMAIERFIKREGSPYDYVIASSVEEAQNVLESEKFDVAVLDYLIGHKKAFDLFDKLNETPIIIVTGIGDEAVAVKAMKAGAYDYLRKDTEGHYFKILHVTLENVIRRKQSEEELKQYREYLEELAEIRTAELQKEIKECEQAEEQLRFQAQLLDSVRESVVATDLEGHIIYWGKGSELLYGYFQEEVMGKPITCLVEPDTRKDEEERMQQVLDSGVWTGQYMKHRKDKTLFWADTIISLVYDQNDQPCAMIRIDRDITERKRAQEALVAEHNLLAQKVKERTAELQKANVELERAVRLKDEFLANMSHELRTPLHIILGLSEALQERVYGELNAKQLTTVSTIEEKGHHLLELITALLDLSRIMTKNLDLEFVPVSVESVGQTSVDSIKPLAEKKQIHTSFTFESSVTTIQADERRLKQVLVNLLNNAVKFTPEGGAIGLKIEEDSQYQGVCFTVWDTGIGITKEDMEQLFTQPLVQLDGKLSRRYPGIGLGLSLTYHIVNMHGGSIRLESEIGKGSRFTVILPQKAPLSNEKIP